MFQAVPFNAVPRSSTTAARRRVSPPARARSQRCASPGASCGGGMGAALVAKRLGVIIAVVSSVVSSTDNNHAIPLGTFFDIASDADATGQTHQQGHSHRSY